MSTPSPAPSCPNESNRRHFIGLCAAAGLLVSSNSLIDNVFGAEKDASSDSPASPPLPAPPLVPSPEVGKPYPGWKEGDLDLHFIYTGVGESCFHILPDGTSILIDAGDRDTDKYPKNAILLPDNSRHSGEWVARYIQRVNPNGNQVDYMMASHFHDDHCGGELFYSEKTTGRTDDYYLSGLTQTAEFIHFDKSFDRGYPNFDKPIPISSHEERNWRKFLQWQQKTNGLKPVEFLPGRADQIVLTKNPDKYQNRFAVRNICSNGVVCSPETNAQDEFNLSSTRETRSLFDQFPNNKSHINENSLSLGVRFSYGPFRFFSGGDVSGRIVDEQNKDVNLDALVGAAVGKVNVCKANHHSYLDAMRAEFVKQVQAQVYIVNVWDQLHIQDNTMSNMASEELYSGERIICPTNYPPERKEMYRDKFWQRRVVKDDGHVVVKVFDEGRQFKVYYLTANDESMTIKSVYGPFKS